MNKKIFTNSKYLIKIITFLRPRKISQVFLDRETIIIIDFKIDIIYSINVLFFRLNTIILNFVLFVIFTYLVKTKIFLVI